jgi:ABC-type polysaccharide/polyol phosphate transport system ATPase subunit
MLGVSKTERQRRLADAIEKQQRKNRSDHRRAQIGCCPQVAISLKGISKKYKHFELKNVTFEMEQGTVAGLIGPDGSWQVHLYADHDGLGAARER